MVELSDSVITRRARLAERLTTMIEADHRVRKCKSIDFSNEGGALLTVELIPNSGAISREAIARGGELRSSLGRERPVWIAGSTHAGEEEQVLEAHRQLQIGQPNALLLLVPRHPDRFEAVAELLRRGAVRFTRRSSGVPPDRATRVVLVDTVGELAALYAAGDVAFVGGSLVPVGGHNLLEPAALGLPVLTGPSYSSSKDIARLLILQGAALEVADARALAAALARLLDDPAARQRMGDIGRHIVESNRGSLARLLELIEPL